MPNHAMRLHEWRTRPNRSDTKAVEWNKVLTTMTEIEEAVRSLYETFSRYSRPTIIESCPCGCTKPGATDHLTAVPLQMLCFAELADYSISAMTTQGSVEDFRYFVPRLFQGVTEEPYSYNPEVLFEKLRYAKWTNWQDDEIRAVKAYLHALWRKGLASFPLEEHLPAFFEIETLLASIAQTGEELEPYLQVWTETKTKEADEHLIQFVTMQGAEFSEGRTLHEAFWKDSKPQAEALRRWLLQPDTLQRIGNAECLLKRDGFEHLFGPAVEILLKQQKFQ